MDNSYRLHYGEPLLPLRCEHPIRPTCVSCGSCLNGVYLACCDTCLTFYRTYGCFSILPHPSGFSPCPTRSSALGKGPYTQDAGLLPVVRFYRRTSAHYRTILLQPARFGKLFRAKEHYKTLYFARFLETCFDTTKSDLYARAKAHVPVCPYPSFSRM